MQVPRAWYAKMDIYFLSYHFVICKLDPNIYMIITSNSFLILFLYVDDLLVIGSSASTIYAVKDILHDKFSMTDMGPLHFFLGLKINQDALGIKLSQIKYSKDILVRFHMTDYKSSTTPFLYRVHIKDDRDTPWWKTPCIDSLWGSFCISPTPDHISHMH
jgi:hypothetical protein